MTYVTPNGRRLTLAYHSPAEWADRVEAILRALGCSDEYVMRAGYQIRHAQVPR